jgi:GTP diphosphokinase / guanosine-3',5'-bis(diphosphate) 3'-diphosphatase
LNTQSQLKVNKKNDLPKSLSLLLVDYNKVDQEKISLAYFYAENKHINETRFSGKPYITHPVRIAVNLIKNEFDVATIQAGLLHDVLENTETTYDEMKKYFGAEVTNIVDGVTKVSSYRLKDKPKVFSDNSLYLERVDNYRKLLFAAANDPRIIIVKLFDRLDNIETIHWMPKEKQKFYARETIEIFAPLAERLGMGFLKGQLEDKSFPYAYPEEYKKFIKEVTGAYKNAKIFVRSIIPYVRSKVEKENVDLIAIDGRAKFYYSLYKKLQRKKDIHQIYDILALRLIVKSIEDCYKTLGIIHSLYTPLPDKIKDYIAKPKDNGYQSLHTTVKDKAQNTFEVQIRTEEMHEIAEYGIASHWHYKEKNHSFGHKDSVLDWVAELEKLKNITNKKEFLSELKENFFAHQVFVFTPKGDILHLPFGSTPIDFAYKIHTSLGHRTLGAKINKRIAPLSTILKTGDTVEIITSKVINPKADWLNFVKTSHASRKINAIIRTKHEASLAEIGLKKINNQISEHKLPPLDKAEAERLIRRSRFPYNTLNKALAAFTEKNFGIMQFLKTVFPNFKNREKRSSYVLSQSNLLDIPSLTNIRYELASCCKPKKQDSVIGYIGKKPIIMIHKIDCQKIANVDKRRLIDL